MGKSEIFELNSIDVGVEGAFHLFSEHTDKFTWVHIWEPFSETIGVGDGEKVDPFGRYHAYLAELIDVFSLL